jgi:alkanesulfonate monooxygenase SsuD/methylene tetrahydromethanopterin reductase-like flavin-dependent oxidoreductase (luciferase family)
MATREQLTQFRFDPDLHEYTDRDGRPLPHITGMLERCGWIDRTWYDDEASERGRQVHRLTADFDMGALDVGSFVSKYRPWLLSYVGAMQTLRPTWDAIEAPAVHPDYRFGGRPDRVGKVFGIYTILEVKSNNKGWNLEKAHPIQTALQAVLVSATRPLPAEAWTRYALYCRPNGKFRLEPHEQRRKDFDEAYRIVKECCR